MKMVYRKNTQMKQEKRKSVLPEKQRRVWCT